MFLSGIQFKNGQQSSSAYLLEFDNGRHVFITGQAESADQYRPFVYQMRDDGKSIDMAIFPSNGPADVLAESISLLQPKLALLTPTDQEKYNLDQLRSSVEEQLFYGHIYLTKVGDRIPF